MFGAFLRLSPRFGLFAATLTQIAEPLYRAGFQQMAAGPSGLADQGEIGTLSPKCQTSRSSRCFQGRQSQVNFARRRFVIALHSP